MESQSQTALADSYLCTMALLQALLGIKWIFTCIKLSFLNPKVKTDKNLNVI